VAKPGIDIEYSVLSEHESRLDEITGKQLDKVRRNTLVTISRRVKPEAARLLSAHVLNLAPRTISPFLTTKINSDNSVTLSARNSRLPLSAFKPRKGPNGVIATLWRDAGPREFAHTFISKKGKRNVWQRVPFTGQKGQTAAPSGLVQRLPIVVRKGPSFYRALVGRKHGDIFPELMTFSRSVLSAEIERQLDLAKNG
jgi:hypothetical protein